MSPSGFFNRLKPAPLRKIAKKKPPKPKLVPPKDLVFEPLANAHFTVNWYN
jgi:hypothetical protein